MTVTADPDFGPILLAQKPNKGNIGNGIFLLVCGVFLLALGVPAIVFLPVSKTSIGGGITFIVVGLSLCGFVFVMLRRNWMHVFLQERGIREFRQKRGRSLRYDQVDELTYSSLRIFLHGLYMHTVQKLALKSHNVPGPPLVCTLIFKEADGRSSSETRSALTDVRNWVSDLLEDRFLQRLGREATVDWTPEVRIGLHGLDLANRNGVREYVAWQRVSKMETDQGWFRLWVDADVKPLLQTTTAQPNFFPAYSLALRLWKRSGV
jgi:hypothetical protein